MSLITGDLTPEEKTPLSRSLINKCRSAAHLYGSVWRPLQLQPVASPPLQPQVYSQERMASSNQSQRQNLQSQTSDCSDECHIQVGSGQAAKSSSVYSGNTHNGRVPHQLASSFLRPNPQHPHLQASSLRGKSSQSGEMHITISAGRCMIKVTIYGSQQGTTKLILQVKVT